MFSSRPPSVLLKPSANAQRLAKQLKFSLCISQIALIIWLVLTIFLSHLHGFTFTPIVFSIFNGIGLYSCYGHAAYSPNTLGTFIVLSVLGSMFIFVQYIYGGAVTLQPLQLFVVVPVFFASLASIYLAWETYLSLFESDITQAGTPAPPSYEPDNFYGSPQIYRSQQEAANASLASAQYKPGERHFPGTGRSLGATKA